MAIFFTDLDGTLLNKQSMVSPRTRDAILDFIAAGNKFVVASGRALGSIQGVLSRAGLPYDNLLIISYNGSYVYDMASSRALIEYRMDREDIRYLMNQTQEMGLHFHTYTDTSVICAHPDPETDYYIASNKIPVIYQEDVIAGLQKGPFKALAIDLKNKSRLLALKERLTPWMNGKYDAIFSCNEFLEFIDSRSGKGNAVRSVCRMLDIPIEDAYAAGDAANDISMLEAAGHSIAMCNGTEEVKAVASMVTELDNDHDGLVAILTKLTES